jgi:hypothetical protein
MPALMPEGSGSYRETRPSCADAVNGQAEGEGFLVDSFGNGSPVSGAGTLSDWDGERRRRPARRRGRYQPGTELIRRADAAIHTRDITTIPSARGSVISSAHTPINGGPARKPQYPAGLTAAIP